MKQYIMKLKIIWKMYNKLQLTKNKNNGIASRKKGSL